MSSLRGSLRGRFRRGLPVLFFVLLLPLVVGCEGAGRSDLPPPPSARVVEGYYSYSGNIEVEISGNVARITVEVDPAPFERGGDLWAKGMPYLFLFSAGTKALLDEHPGLGGVRIVTRHPEGDVMAEALLARGTLNDFTWQRALQLAARARTEASERPGRMRDLVLWGEDHTEFMYNPRYISTR